jgi:putative SOS response-associated peptidase YedK
MWNLYSITRSQEAMRRLFRVKRDFTGNLAALPAVYPDTMAPVVRTARDGERELILMHWGFPPPPISAMRQSPMSAIRNRPIGADGSRPNGAASFRQRRFANGQTAGRR